MQGLPPTTYLPYQHPSTSSFKLRCKMTSSGMCCACESFPPEGAVAFPVCARCKAASYCSLSCQRLDWANHKIACFTEKEEKARKDVVEETTVCLPAHLYLTLTRKLPPHASVCRRHLSIIHGSFVFLFYRMWKARPTLLNIHTQTTGRRHHLNYMYGR